MSNAILCGMASEVLRISAVPITTLGAFLEAAFAHPTGDLQELARYAGFSESTARRAVPTLETLGIVVRRPDGCYSVGVDGVARGMSDQDKNAVLRRALLGLRPFEALIEGISLGEPERDAIRKALLLLELHEGDAAKLATLLRFGEDLGIIEYRNGQAALVPDFEPSTGDDFVPVSAQGIESEAKARLFNARRLGRGANNYLDEIDRGLLADALLKHESDPRKSVDAAGQALEDFLRHVADDRGLSGDAKKASGAGQLANLLHAKGVIHSHQQKLVDAVATIRNATAHRKDKRTLTPWELTSFGAFSAFSMTLTAIRSIHAYTPGGRQTI